MAVLKMRRISITALKKDRKPILEKLQALGIMEMHQIEPEGFSVVNLHLEIIQRRKIFQCGFCLRHFL